MVLHFKRVTVLIMLFPIGKSNNYSLIYFSSIHRKLKIASKRLYLLVAFRRGRGGQPLKEIRIHGRGGQGSVTAAELIAIAAFEDKRFSQAFPAFGVERRGAPVMAFVRIADKPIRIRSQIYEPNYVVVQDVSLLDVVNVASGLKSDGKIIINTDKPKENLNLKTEAEIVTIDATKIAMETLGRPIVNSIMLGAFCKATKEVSLESINKAISERFKGDLGKKNLLAIKTAYEKVA
jgi:pyruvate ferredoxin oxidoreductase gamma subunit